MVDDSIMMFELGAEAFWGQVPWLVRILDQRDTPDVNTLRSLK